MFRITLIGPDGCGKSAVAEQLVKRMRVPVRRIYMGVNLESSNIMLPTSRLQLAIRRWRGLPPDAAGPRDPNCRNSGSGSLLKRAARFLKGGLRISHLIAEECFRLAVIRWWLFRGYVVVQDRDFFVDFHEYDVVNNGHRTLWQRIHGFFLKRVYSKPDLTILLDVSAETMLARKQEGTPESLQRRWEYYRTFLDQMPASEVINAEGCLSQVTTLCHDRILQFRQKRIADARNQTAVRVDGPVAIVIGLDCVTGLQTSRILSAYGIRVVGLASNISHFCCRTNTVEHLHHSETHGPELISALRSLRKEFSQDPVLVPCNDLSVLTISEHRDKLQDYRFVLPEHQLLATLIDKVEFARVAEQHLFDVPKTRVLTVQSDAQQAADDLTFPVFLKPAVKTPKWEANTSLKAVRTETPAELLAAWQTYAAFSDALIAQEYIQGSIEDCFTVNVYFDRNGIPRCSYTSQKTRQWPPEFGTACLAQESHNPGVAEQTLAFFKRFNYRGLGYIEFKRDQQTGRHLIIEPNIGRPTGRSAMAEASGVPLLLTMFCDAAELPMPEVSSHANSTQPLKWVHLRRDLQAGMRAVRRGEISLLDWLRSIRGRKIFAVASRRDPRPFLAECRRYLLELVLRRKSKSRRNAAERKLTGHTSASEQSNTPTTVLIGEGL